MKKIDFPNLWFYVESESKTVARRLIDPGVKPGEKFMATKSFMDGTVEEISMFSMYSVRKERLGDLPQSDVIKEGFHDWDASQVVEWYCNGLKCTPNQTVWRFEWETVEGYEGCGKTPTTQAPLIVNASCITVGDKIIHNNGRREEVVSIVRWKNKHLTFITNEGHGLPYRPCALFMIEREME